MVNKEEIIDKTFICSISLERLPWKLGMIVECNSIISYHTIVNQKYFNKLPLKYKFVKFHSLITKRKKNK